MATNNKDFAENIMFQHLTEPRDLTKYTLMRGAPDFAKVEMWNEFESGYAYLTVVQIPQFLEKLKAKSEIYRKLIENYEYALEYEFKSLSGIENITSEQGTIDTGHATLGFINKVTMQSNSTFSMNYTEKCGALFTKVHELFLTGIKDPRTQVKHYHGLLESGEIVDAGYEQETFSFMYFVTDNTMRKVEKAFYIVAAQPTSAEWNIFNYEKGNIEFKEITLEFTGFPITGNEVDQKAKEMLDWLNNASNPNKMVVNSNNFSYSGVKDINTEI